MSITISAQDVSPSREEPSASGGKGLPEEIAASPSTRRTASSAI